MRDEIHRKIGRNIVLWQKIELALKSFVARQNCTLSVNSQNPELPSPQDQIEQKRESVARKTLGCLSQRFCETVLTDSRPHPNSGELTKGESRLTFSFHPFVGHSDYQKEFAERLDSIVKDRNRIVHQLFTTFDLSESRNTEDLSAYLDQLHDKANFLFCDLKSLNEAVQEFGKLLAELELSPFPNDSLNNISIQSLIVNLLIFPYQSNKASTSGWVDLSKAGAFIHQQCLSDYLKSKKKYQVGSLKKLLIKTEIFDLIDEANQTFYRIKPEYYIEATKDGILNFCKRTICPSGGESVFSQELNIQLTTESPLNEANPDC